MVLSVNYCLLSVEMTEDILIFLTATHQHHMVNLSFVTLEPLLKSDG